MTAAAIGSYWLVAWLVGWGAQWSADPVAITVKTNMALAQLLAGIALLLLGQRSLTLSMSPEDLHSSDRTPATSPWHHIAEISGMVAALLVLLIGLLTLSEHLFGWDLGIDELLAHEEPGSRATLSPNRMGYPGSLCLSLVGAGLLLLRQRQVAASYLGLAVCLIIMLPAVGFIYGISPFFSRPMTGVAWPTVVALFSLGVGLMMAQCHRGPLAILLRRDLGGVLLRRLLPATILVPLILGYLLVQGRHLGYYTMATGVGALMIVMILLLSALGFWAAHALSKTEAKQRNQAELMDYATEPLIMRELSGVIRSWNRGAQELYGFKASEAVGQHLQQLLQSQGTPLEEKNARLKRTGSWAGELTRTTRDGRRVIIESRQTATRTPQGHLLILESDRDITDRKRAEERLLRQARELEQWTEALEQRVRERTAQLQELTRELAQTEQRERERLTQMLHDGLQQILVAARMHADLVTEAEDVLVRRQRALQLVKLLNQAIADCRSLSMELSPPALRDQGLVAGLHWLVQWMSEQHHFAVELELDPGFTTLDRARDLLLFQCIRELLLNTVKHAGTQQAKIRLWLINSETLCVEVIDHGRGFDSTLPSHRKHGSFGMASIQQRLEIMEGQFEIQSRAGHGTTVRICVPLVAKHCDPTPEVLPGPEKNPQPVHGT